MRYVFGPVNSRRFGTSLGIDLSPDKKSCNFDCVYCELDRAKPVASITNPPQVGDIVNEVKKSLEKFSDIEVITITSNGEPTLYKDIDKLVEELNSIKKDKKLLILTNSSTICDKSIQKTLSKIDIVKLSLDCVTPKCFKRIDRPLKNIEIEKIVKCMEDFSKDFHHILVVEVLLVKGINDNIQEMTEVVRVLQNIKPHRVDIGTIDRPPAYDVKAVDESKIIELSKLFQDMPVSLIRKNKPVKKEDFNEQEILNLVSHRPQSSFDIDYFFSDNSKKIVAKLLNEGEMIKKDIAGVIFYTINSKNLTFKDS